MKCLPKVLLSLSLLLTAAHIVAQTYLPFPEPGMEQGDWYSGNVYHSPPDGRVSIRYDGDTIWQGKIYAKICRMWVTQAGWCPYRINYFTRFDSGKIYLQEPLDTFYSERLWYDFSLTIGDTFSLTQGYGFDRAVVVQKDTIVLSDGVKRINMYLKGVTISVWNVPFHWIEGIGDTATGFFGDEDFEGGHTTFICHKTSFGPIYENPSPPVTCTSSLDVSTSMNDVKPEHFIVIMEPESEELLIKADVQMDRIILFDALGRKVSDNRSGTTTANIPVNSLSRGIYFVTICSGGELYKAQKIVKM